jgi:Zn-dependent peptidase ImmA (M78 family)
MEDIGSIEDERRKDGGRAKERRRKDEGKSEDQYNKSGRYLRYRPLRKS